jgi:processive 1,2-diacylglycerol beta-glucosyltransferase
VRALILAAAVGESHLAMARVLAAELEEQPEPVSATVVSDFSALGGRIDGILSRGYRFHLGRVKWSYDLAYRLFTGVGPARAFGERALAALGGSALQRMVEGERPDVVVSTHPVMNPVLGALRARGRISCPVAAVVGPLGGLDFWVQPGIDLHLLHYAEALDAVRRRIGRGAARPIRPLVRGEFFEPLSRAEARMALGVSPDGEVVLISGGGWGAGDLAGAIDAALRLKRCAVIAVAGRNDALRHALALRYADQPRVSVIGFTDRMRDLMCAADAFVTATAGLSSLEARLCGCPMICYGFAIGHIRDNIRALESHGFARIAHHPGDLERELSRALSDERPAAWPLRDLPTAAELTTELGRGRQIGSGRTRESLGAEQGL